MTPSLSRRKVIGALSIVALMAIHPVALASGTAGEPQCSSVFEGQKSFRQTIVGQIPQAAGLILGSVNGVLLTASGGAVSAMPEQLAKWLPLFNEIANVTSTATGREWIYSGRQKQVIDGIALGGIAGQALSVGAEKGMLAGALTFGVSVGLTYWFPNKYFHSIMQGIPKLLPGAAQKAALSSVGQGAIGISMIVVLERVLEHAQHLVQLAPQFLSVKSGSTRAVASEAKRPSISIAHALALSILESALQSEAPGHERTQRLLHVAGAGADGDLFLNVAAVARPEAPLRESDRVAILAKLNGEAMSVLLSPAEIHAIRQRL